MPGLGVGGEIGWCEVDCDPVGARGYASSAALGPPFKLGMADKKPPTKGEQFVGVLLILGALFWMGKCAVGGKSEPTQAACQTDLDCKIRATTERMKDACVTAASGQRHLEDRQFDLARGLRTGSMSASDVREAQAEIEATRQYADKAKADCEAARADMSELGKQATAAYRQSEAAKQAPAAPAAAATPTPATAKTKPKAKPAGTQAKN